MNPQATTLQEARPTESKFKTSLKLTRAAWRVVKLDKEILGLSSLSIGASIALFVAYSAALLLFSSVFFTPDEAFTPTPWFYVLSGILGLVGYVVANYFAGAISHAAFQRFDGQNPTFSEATEAANRRIVALVNFSGLQATVGIILNILEDRLPFAGKIAVWLTGAAWGVASMFAIPLIMDKGERNPFKVVKTSAQTFLSIWQESIFVGISLGVIGIIATITIMFFAVGSFVLAAMLSSVTLTVVGGVIFVAGIATIVVATQALQSVVMTAAYYYASRRKLPAGFDEELVRSMFRPKKKWLR